MNRMSGQKNKVLLPSVEHFQCFFVVMAHSDALLCTGVKHGNLFVE